MQIGLYRKHWRRVLSNLDGNPVVESRLNMFGYWKGRTYYLNKMGMEYAMRGCSSGIIEKQAKDEFAIAL